MLVLLMLLLVLPILRFSRVRLQPAVLLVHLVMAGTLSPVFQAVLNRAND